MVGDPDRSSGPLCPGPHCRCAVHRGCDYYAVDGDPWLGAEGGAASQISFSHRDSPGEAGLSSSHSRDHGLAQGPAVSPRTAWHTGSRASGQSLGRALLLPTLRPPFSLCEMVGEDVSPEAPPALQF